MLFSLIHPSRGRSSQAFETYLNWMNKASDKNTYQYILSIDDDDKQKSSYWSAFKDTGVQIICNKNRSLVDAVNNAAKISNGNLLVVVSDDFDCPKDWDIALSEDIFNRKSCDTRFAVLVNDGYSKDLMTIPMVSISLYKELGYIYHPDYFSMYADNDLFELCDIRKCIIRSNHLFQHKHYCNGMAKIDATYERQNSKEAFKIGESVLKRRRETNFI